MLEKIEGIGPSKAKLLLKEFGSIGEIKKASIEDLKNTKGISNANAIKIHQYFQKDS